MDVFGTAQLGLLGRGDGLRDDASWSADHLPGDVYPASGLALAAAYHDIKTRLASLERENNSIKRKLKHYEVKFPMMRTFGEERMAIMEDHPETTNLQHRINSLTQELQQSKEREEQLEDVIQAYEKIHLEKSNIQRDLDKMTTLAERHMEQICSLESALRQRETSLQKLNSQLRNKDAHRGRLHASLLVPREGRGPTLQSSCSLDALSDVKLQRLEAELEGALHQAEGASQREKELRAELQRLQEEVTQLQEAHTTREELDPHCEHCDVEWIKKAGDEQVNLALAYTELTEELGRVRTLTAKQNKLLLQTQQEPGSRPPSAPQRFSAASPKSTSLTPDRLIPSPPLHNGPASYSHQPTSSHLRAKFQSRRSYSEVSEPSSIQRFPSRLMRDPVSTLPKPRSFFGEAYGQSKSQLRGTLAGLVRPASAHGGDRRVGSEGDGGVSSPHHHVLDLGFPLTAEVHHFCQLDQPTMLVTPPQSSDDEEDVSMYLSAAASPPPSLREQSLLPPFSSPRKQPQSPSFSAPEGPTTLSCHLPADMNAEHAQSWPSINLWMESEESAVRSCPLCQLTFPTGYPDDALIKHIDSHLENSKI
ncbi:TANK-binding kinase 1-binding protein 1-like isoform X5 [Dunckerocampus dactyliophorus]|uniref:TANK-binding kinase 1-binding protein 1-like isoform X5 n=1 Tax=Dunckerocampus dactyliophorus TaxID=161453 RepID=UPI002406C4E1|nr:TANK-binding kinase 1-binding protein 1-like isoform X5 [Dunckerocampus dactyliophorus]XP_054615267.1 TANK-binding kinase 1-binding protein 1-like isoform X5 [Dunckerocampus dactyliophorus]